eukprot:CAMPEP_0196821656 /NCGR_PEP_ID=MMETSP1362-20130617/80281_1 /TAXON_ID=163516 /ORGANISM="Leptocylindrus danicus, Strain CCMP1856" /LENGTH=313 /DNA_ID=CAMNT_0042200939 /DNA_START=458 /DNA_END=1399 /DNA_ORIENTATION=+
MLNPDSVSTISVGGKLPLHAACESTYNTFNSPTDDSYLSMLIDLLIEKNPASLVFPDEASGWMPLHSACRSGSCHLIRLLAENDEEGIAVRARDKENMTCLHLACLNGAPLKAIRILLDLYPEALAVKSDHGYLPVHCCCLNGADKTILQLLSSKVGFAESVMEVDSFGRTPLHYACEWNVTADVVHIMIEGNPEIVQVADEFGMTPLHLAAAKQCTTVVDVLCYANSFALKVKNHAGQTPLDYAISCYAFPDVIAALKRGLSYDSNSCDIDVFNEINNSIEKKEISMPSSDEASDITMEMKWSEEDIFSVVG